jgi:hypothetical protein
MHNAIVVVRRDRKKRIDGKPVWDIFLSNLAAYPEDRKQLAENVWLVNFYQNPQALAGLVNATVQYDLPYMIFPIGDASDWLPGGSDPLSVDWLPVD